MLKFQGTDLRLNIFVESDEISLNTWRVRCVTSRTFEFRRLGSWVFLSRVRTCAQNILTFQVAHQRLKME